uniref:Ulp1 protease family, C-terminal catalytic domain containing protein n=1 Tax=Solanum tuberosum TaxID=4113 RepID=M1DN28_SOLTU
MVKKTIPKITPKKGDSDSDFVDSPPKTSNFSHASTSRYPIRSKDNSKGKQRESIGVVDKKIKKRVISVEVARRRRIIDSEDEEDDDDRSEEAKVLVCNRKESVQKTVRKKKNAKIGKAQRREVVESVVDNRVLKEWDYYVPKGLTFTRARFSSHVNTSIVELLKLKLSSVQLDMFRKTVFGHFLDMKPFFVQNQVLCYLMRKELVQDRLDKFYVDINGSRLCFGIEEFAAVTGLKCDGDVVAKDFYEYTNRLKRTYFPNRMNVDKNQLANCFLNKKWNSDEDAVKIAVLYFIFTFLLSVVANRNFISDQLFYLVESGEYMSFPWGKKAFLEFITFNNIALLKICNLPSSHVIIFSYTQIVCVGVTMWYDLGIDLLIFFSNN